MCVSYSFTIAEPAYALLADIFKLNKKGWLKRNTISAAKTMLQGFMGDSLTSYVSIVS